MSDPFLMLGIESSCDETAAAIVAGDGTILSLYTHLTLPTILLV